MVLPAEHDQVRVLDPGDPTGKEHSTCPGSEQRPGGVSLLNAIITLDDQ